MICADKIAFVTGAGNGIGRACALALAGAGATVTLTDIDADGLAETVGLIEAAGGTCFSSRQDVVKETEWQSMIADIEARHGKLHILVNNAGIAVSGLTEELSLADWQRQMAVNVDSVFLGTKYAIPLMRKTGGSIINISSIAGLRGAAGLSAYCASKGAVKLFTKSLALELAEDNIRVNSVHPGIIDTDIWQKDIGHLSLLNEAIAVPGANAIDPQAMSDVVVPSGRLGKPQEIAQAVLFLASDMSSYMTGSEVVVDYGATAS